VLTTAAPAPFAWCWLLPLSLLAIGARPVRSATAAAIGVAAALSLSGSI
jgi:hypothetical protein